MGHQQIKASQPFVLDRTRIEAGVKVRLPNATIAWLKSQGIKVTVLEEKEGGKAHERQGKSSQ